MADAVNDANSAIKDALNFYKVGKSAVNLLGSAPSFGSLGSGIGALASLGGQFIDDPTARAGVTLGGQAAGIGAGLAAGLPGAVVGGIGGLIGAGAALAVGGQQAAKYKKEMQTQRALGQDLTAYQGVPSVNTEGVISNLGALMSGGPGALSNLGPGGLQALLAYGNQAKIPTAYPSGAARSPFPSQYDPAGLQAQANIRQATGNNLAVVPTTQASPYAKMPAYQFSGDLAALQNDPNKISLAASGNYPVYGTPDSVSTPLGPMTPQAAAAQGFKPKDYVDSLKWAAAQSNNDTAAVDQSYRNSPAGTGIPQNMAVNPNLWNYVNYAGSAPARPSGQTFQAPGAGAVSSDAYYAPPNTAPAQAQAAYRALMAAGVPMQAAQGMAAPQPPPVTFEQMYASQFGGSPDARLASGGDVPGALDALVSIGNDDTTMPGDPGYLDNLDNLSPRQRALLYQNALDLSPESLASYGLARGGMVPPGLPHMGMPRMGNMGGMRGPNLAMHGPGSHGGMMRLMRGSGLIRGEASGRSDALQADLPKGGYVVPADVVSGMGQGNTAAGASSLRSMIQKSGPRFARGGMIGTARVKVSPGEFFVHPHHVAALGDGDLNKGSAHLDNLVKQTRKRQARAIRKLPKPR